MTGELRGKVAIVTGAAGDIGEATVALMLEQGARVLAVDVGEAALAGLAGRMAASGNWANWRADVTIEAEVAGCVARALEVFGRLDLLFNNAGTAGGREGAWRLTPEVAKADFEAIFAVNVTGVFLMMKHAIPAMLRTGGGAIVNVASVAALRPGPGQIAYSASKAAVIGMTRTAALEWSERNIRANCVAPGLVEGRMMEEIVGAMGANRDGGPPPGMRGAMIPAGRWAGPVEIARVVAFLASDRAAFVTGAVYPVDGGFSA